MEERTFWMMEDSLLEVPFTAVLKNRNQASNKLNTGVLLISRPSKTGNLSSVPEKEKRERGNKFADTSQH